MTCTCANTPGAACSECPPTVDLVSAQAAVVSVLQRQLMRDAATNRVRDVATALAMAIDKLHLLRTGTY